VIGLQLIAIKAHCVTTMMFKSSEQWQKEDKNYYSAHNLVRFGT